MLRERIKKVHMVGIGGIGMSGIAKILLEMGYEVSGSDISENSNVRELVRMGAKIFVGHSEENLSTDTQVVVYSSAIKEDNPEIRKALRLGIPVIPRGEMLAELFKLKEGIAVSGSHGKTTTTSMIAHILEEAGYDPTVIIGGKLKRLGGNAKLGKGDLLVSEADESDGTFLKLSPAVAVVTNVDREHLDFYGSYEEVVKSFRRFLESVPFYGFCVVNADDEGTKKASSGVKRKLVSFGLGEDATFRATNLRVSEGGFEFDVYYRGSKEGSLKLPMAGRHNVYNALASLATALEIGISFKEVKGSLETFKNAERRMELKGYIGSVPVYDDYGHHPTEIKSVLEALKEIYPSRNIFLIFQPHRYSRTYLLMDDFVRVLKEADKAIVTEIYPAGEENVYGISGKEIALKSGADFSESKEDLFKKIEEEISESDLLLFMGAGSISTWCREFLERFKDGSLRDRSSL